MGVGVGEENGGGGGGVGGEESGGRTGEDSGVDVD